MSTQTNNFQWYIPAHGETDWDKINTGLQTFVHFWIHEIDAFLGNGFTTVRGIPDQPGTSVLEAWKGIEWKWASGDAVLEYVPDFYSGEIIPYGPYADPVPAVLSRNGIFAVQPDQDSPWNVAGFLVVPGHVGPYGEHGGSGGWDTYPSPLGGIVDFDNGWATFRVGSWSEGISGTLVVSGPIPVTLDSVRGEIKFGFGSGYLGYDPDAGDFSIGRREQGLVLAEICPTFTDPAFLNWDSGISKYRMSLSPIKYNGICYSDTIPFPGFPPAPITLFLSSDFGSDAPFAVSQDNEILQGPFGGTLTGTKDVDLILAYHDVLSAYATIYMDADQTEAMIQGLPTQGWQVDLVLYRVFIANGSGNSFTFNPSAFEINDSAETKFKVLSTELEFQKNLKVADGFVFIGRKPVPIVTGGYLKNILPNNPVAGDVFYAPEYPDFNIQNDLLIVRNAGNDGWIATEMDSLIVDFVPQLKWDEDGLNYIANCAICRADDGGNMVIFDDYPDFIPGVPAIVNPGSVCSYIKCSDQGFGLQLDAIKIVGSSQAEVCRVATRLSDSDLSLNGVQDIAVILAKDNSTNRYFTFYANTNYSSYVETYLNSLPNISVERSSPTVIQAPGVLGSDYTWRSEILSNIASTNGIYLWGSDGDNENRIAPLPRHMRVGRIDYQEGRYRPRGNVMTYLDHVYGDSLDGDSDSNYVYYIEGSIFGDRQKIGNPYADDVNNRDDQTSYDLQNLDINGNNDLDVTLASKAGAYVTFICSNAHTANLQSSLTGDGWTIDWTLTGLYKNNGMFNSYDTFTDPLNSDPTLDFWGADGCGGRGR